MPEDKKRCLIHYCYRCNRRAPYVSEIICEDLKARNPRPIFHCLIRTQNHSQEAYVSNDRASFIRAQKSNEQETKCSLM